MGKYDKIDLSSCAGRLTYIRKRILGLTGDKFGGLLGVSQDTVSIWDRGRVPKGKVLVRIAELGDCSIDWILDGKGRAPGGYSKEVFEHMDLKTMGERIEYLREHGLKLSRGELAKKLGVQEAQVLGYEQGELQPQQPVLSKFAEIAGVSFDFLVFGKRGIPEEAMPEEERIKKLERKLEALEKFIESEFKIRRVPEKEEVVVLDLISLKPKVPVVASIPAGYPIEIRGNEVIDWILVPEGALIKKDKEIFGVQVDGDSMSPELLPGDYVIVEAQTRAEKGDIVVCRLNGEAMIKEFTRQKDNIILKSRNSMYSPIVVTSEDDFQIIGVVYGVGLRKLRK